MKRLLMMIVVLALFMCIIRSGNAQPPPPPAKPDAPYESENDPVGGGAPIGEGTCFLILLGAGYAIKKLIGELKTKVITE